MTRTGASETKRQSGTQANESVEHQKIAEINLCTVTQCLPQKLFTHTPSSTPMMLLYYPATLTFPVRLNGDSEAHLADDPSCLAHLEEDVFGS